MDQIIDKQHCYGCSACYSKCPKQAITMIADSEGFLNPVINQELCIDCGICKRVCPGYADKVNNYICSFGAYSKDQKIHSKSSSGGIFMELALETLRNNGVVYGAAFNESNAVIHQRVTDFDELESLQGSKYVQSKIGNSYLLAQQDLCEGRSVLFSGTPCQIAGLKQFLGKNYDTLLTVDLICHGVPSQKVFDIFLGEVFEEGVKIEKMNFRNKELGINHSRLSFLCQNSETRFIDYAESEYTKSFLNNLSLRQSCYNCQFKSFNRYSDITLGDFWSVGEFYPSLLNDQGISAVVVNTLKGLKSFQIIQNRLEYIEADIEKVKTWNSNYENSAEINNNREVFFNEIGKRRLKSIVESMVENRNSKSVGSFKNGLNKLNNLFMFLFKR